MDFCLPRPRLDSCLLTRKCLYHLVAMSALPATAHRGKESRDAAAQRRGPDRSSSGKDESFCTSGPRAGGAPQRTGMLSVCSVITRTWLECSIFNPEMQGMDRGLPVASTDDGVMVPPPSRPSFHNPTRCCAFAKNVFVAFSCDSC